MSVNFVQPPVVENASPAIGTRATGTVIKVSIDDPSMSDVIDAGFDRLILERSDDLGLSWLEITSGSERPVLEKDKSGYSITDRGGSVEFFYRTRYIATRGAIQGQCSEASEPIVGAGLAIRNILTIDELKSRYLFGVDFTDDQGRALTDATFLHYITAAVRWIEHELDIPILPTSFTDVHDYHRTDYQSFNFIQLDNYPVISLEEFALQYPSGQNVVVYPLEWMRLDKIKGHIQVVPTAGTLSEVMIGSGGSWLPAIYSGQDYLPGLFQISYTAGFEEGRVPRNITDLIGMFASLGPFNIFGDLIAGAGIATLSLSLDGLSQSIGTTSSATNAGYGSRIIQYLKQIKSQIETLRRFYKGTRFVVA